MRQINLQLETPGGQQLPPPLRSAKRTARERAGIHAWHSYYAGYSEAFVESALDYLNLRTNSLIVDPWSGSGTTTSVAARSGIPSLGIDINPVMAVFSAAKAPQAAISDRHLEKLLEIFEQLSPLPAKDDPLHEVLSPSLARCVRQMASAISEYSSDFPLPEPCAACKKDTSILNPVTSFFLAALFVAARKLSGFKKASNPTWFKSLERKPTCSHGHFRQEYKSTFLAMAENLQSFYSHKAHDVACFALVGDSRSLPLRSTSCSAIITSPPYLTRIDYAISTKLELLIMQNGSSSLIRSVRDQSMGATVIRPEQNGDVKRWGPTCQKILDEVRGHSSKAAESYYLKNIRQYYSDAYDSLREMKRIVRKGGHALIVVQSSYFKEVEMPLGNIYIEMAASLDLNAHVAYRDTVRGHMAHVNTKSSGYRKNKVYYEDIVDVEF